MQAMLSDTASALSSQRAHSHLENGSEPQSQGRVRVMTRFTRESKPDDAQGIKLPIFPIQPR